jgi:CheY-like chemotaxis protein
MPKKVTILVVDDSDLIRYSLKGFFSEYDIEVVSCMDGLEGIQKALENLPALIFLDLMMPNFDGVKMLQVIKIIDALKNIPVVVISGNTNKPNVLAALEAGADRVIPKPLQKEIILKNVSEILGEDFLKESQKVNVAEEENKEILNKLCSIFLDHYPVKKRQLDKAIETKDRGSLFNVIHELKGAGGTIGYPIISIMCSDIEKAIDMPLSDWDYIKIKCEQIYSVIEKIEFSKTVPNS